ncbi:MAG TPA: hypothetical protein PK191_06970 [Niabella sp.]|mgnify:CR=1 FL=1|nr:hypothetical protein [Niabella sp.]HOZ96190.1 hypothetical protein [Niabella sp.]HQW13555.1 hypothetical protein [Niabella sp.]HQX18949.1 hypothetical protein [Niabella sp.]HQX40454.1 hypothetical protein [Niabella sp.]
MKLKITLTAVSLLLISSLFAQSEYKKSIGVRVGNGYYDVVSAAYKTFISEKSAIEIDLGIRPYHIVGDNWFNASVSGSYQHHFDIKPVEGLKWFVGGGIVASNSFSNSDAYKGFNLGLFPTAGADYKFNKIPLSVSADIRPTIHVIEAYDYYKSFYPNPGISARYTF